MYQKSQNVDHMAITKQPLQLVIGVSRYLVNRELVIQCYWKEELENIEDRK